MAIGLLLLPADNGDVSLGHEAVTRLRRLGVTSVALVGDDRTFGVVLEGWAFEPGTSLTAAAEAVAGDAADARLLQPVMQMAVSAAHPEGGNG